MKLLKTILFIFKTEAVVPAVEVHLLQECKALLFQYLNIGKLLKVHYFGGCVISILHVTWYVKLLSL